jgi:hypothetical protein
MCATFCNNHGHLNRSAAPFQPLWPMSLNRVFPNHFFRPDSPPSPTLAKSMTMWQGATP